MVSKYNAEFLYWLATLPSRVIFVMIMFVLCSFELNYSFFFI